MATSLKDLKTMDGGDKDKAKAKPTPRQLSDKELANFGQFAGSGDSKIIASYLMKKGLVGADQLYTDHPDISSEKGIINAQSDWKPSAISAMLIRARRAGLKTPTEINANKEALLGALSPRLKEAINHPAFSQIHNNFWPVFSDILKDRYDSENLSTPLPSLATSLAKK